jgi:hypothetical protein
MAMKDFDYKKFLLEKGERVGLIAAAVLAVLLLVTSLLLPPHGFFSGSSVQNAKALRDPTANLENQLLTRKPADADKPPKEAVELIDIKQTYVDGGEHMMANLSPEPAGPGSGRRVPQVYPVAEAVAVAKHIDLQAYVMDLGPEKLIYALKGDKSVSRASSPDAARLTGMMGRGMMGGGRAPMGFGGRGGLGGPGRGRRGGEGGRSGAGKGGQLPEETPEKRLVAIRLNELAKAKYDSLAQQVLPVRTVVIGASFPYRKQIEEFRAKLNLKSAREVLGEPSAEKTREGKRLHSLRFLGVQLQRREIDLDGRPREQWADVPLGEKYADYVLLSGKRFEPELRKYERVLIPGMYMPKLARFRGAARPERARGRDEGDDPNDEGATTDEGVATPAPRPGDPKKKTAKPKEMVRSQWPAVEEMLPHLQEAVEALKGKKVALPAKPPAEFDTTGLNVFGQAPEEDTRDGAARKPAGQTEADKDGNLPEYCLVRLIDVTVKPDKTYEYRLKILMANPNYHRNDVANPDYAREEKLEADWSQVPIRVTVEPERHYYAVDEVDVEGRRNYYKGDPFRDQYRMPINKSQQVVLQAHLWLEELKTRNDTEPTVLGEWVIAERFPVFRGEYIGRTERVQLPVWRINKEAFEIAADATTRKTRPGVEVHFGAGGRLDQEPLLVDFVPSEQYYERPVSRAGGPDIRRIKDQAGVEALMVAADGKLQVLDGALDLEDATRRTRLNEFQEWVKEVKLTGKKVGPGKKGGSPFEGGGGGGPP